MSGTALPKDILNLINAAVLQAVQQTREAMEAERPPEAPRDYFRIMEKLLYNYPTMRRLVADKEGYINTPFRGRSKSIVRQSFNPSWKSQEDIQEEIKRDKESDYDQTRKDFRRVERVIQLHQGRKEFFIIRMYYFGEDLDGTPRPANAAAYTWEEITEALGKINLIRDTKSARRWRNKIVNDMAICLFGIEAAVSSGTIRGT